MIEQARRRVDGMRSRRSERGQILIVFVGILSVVFLLGALVVDVGYFYSERRGVARASDLAALAGIQALPESRTQATAAVMDWAQRNGYANGVDGVTVDVRFFCGNSLARPVEGVCANSAAPYLSNCDEEQGCDALEVKIRKPMKHFFSRIFGVSGTHAGFASLANVKFNVRPADSALLLDATASMREQDPDGHVAINEAKAGANEFVDILLSTSDALSRVGYAPYRDCYSPPRELPASETTPCITASDVVPLTESGTVLHDAINRATAGGGTNICMPFLHAEEMFQAQSDARVKRFIVLLTDGDTEYVGSRSYGEGQPPAPCRPSDPRVYEGTGGACEDSSRPAERELDRKTMDVAHSLESQYDAEIFVIGLSVCGSPTSESRSGGYCGDVGNSDADAVADRRMLRCIASSSAGTNDHYFEVASAAELPPMFRKIAFEIAGRGLAETPP